MQFDRKKERKVKVNGEAEAILSSALLLLGLIGDVGFSLHKLPISAQHMVCFCYKLHTLSNYGVVSDTHSVPAEQIPFYSLIVLKVAFYDDSPQLTEKSKEVEVTAAISLFVTVTAPTMQPRCSNEYFSESKWILLLSQACWHRLQRHRWS